MDKIAINSTLTMNENNVLGVTMPIDSKFVSYDNDITKINADTIQDAIDQLFTSVGEGKRLIASAITDMGVTTEADVSFEEMRKHILSIPMTKYAWWSPHMTSNTTPYPFVASASSVFSAYYPYLAFDGINTGSSDCWSCAQSDPDPWLAFDFGVPTVFNAIRFKTRGFNVDVPPQFPKTIYIDILDREQWQTIYTQTDIPMQTEPDIWAVTAHFINPITAQHVRFSHLADGGFYLSDLVSIAEIEFAIKQ